MKSHVKVGRGVITVQSAAQKREEFIRLMILRCARPVVKRDPAASQRLRESLIAQGVIKPVKVNAA